jgi:hypothetical protein
MRQNLYTGKFFLAIQQNITYFSKMVRIFQQCTHYCEKQNWLTALGLTKKSQRNTKKSKIQHENDDIF